MIASLAGREAIGVWHYANANQQWHNKRGMGSILRMASLGRHINDGLVREAIGGWHHADANQQWRHKQATGSNLETASLHRQIRDHLGPDSTGSILVVAFANWLREGAVRG
jgi:hypothetical protein